MMKRELKVEEEERKKKAKKNKNCWFFKKGDYRRGETCPYKHDNSTCSTPNSHTPPGRILLTVHSNRHIVYMSYASYAV